MKVKEMPGALGTKIIGFYPAKVPNEYQDRMKAITEHRHQAVLVPHVRWLQLNRLKVVDERIDVLFVSWLEDTLVSRKTGKRRLLGPWLYRLKLRMLRRIARKVVMVRHNEFPHHTRASDRETVRAQIDGFEHEFDAVVTHSGHNAGMRYYVPHPLYSVPGHYDASPFDKPYCLAFGFIKPYKNLLSLIESWPGPNRLVIAGPCRDTDYLAVLKKAAQGREVTLAPGFLPDSAAASAMRHATCSILAQSGQDMVVSGSYFFALSHGTPTYALRTPFLGWLEQAGGPGVRCFDTMELLAEQASKAQEFGDDEKQTLSTQATDYFSDEKIADAIEDVVVRLLPASSHDGI